MATMRRCTVWALPCSTQRKKKLYSTKKVVPQDATSRVPSSSDTSKVAMKGVSPTHSRKERFHREMSAAREAVSADGWRRFQYHHATQTTAIGLRRASWSRENRMANFIDSR